MKISGASPVPVPTHAHGSDRKAAAATTDTSVPTPSVSPETPETDAPAQDKDHGLVRAAEHSHRSDVAALRQWINHPELRAGLGVPDLTAEHHGKGFANAVAAYEAASAIVDPAPATDPVVDPTP